MSHTPGPWTAKGRDIESKSYVIGCANAVANAALMAAAPDLLSACVAVAGVFQGANDNDMPLYARKCIAAIAKAQS